MRRDSRALWFVLLLIVGITHADECHDECIKRVFSDEEEFDVACNDTCKIQKCYDGCDSWMEAVSSSCHNVCKEEKKTLNEELNMYCVRGCNIATSMYVDAIKDQLGTPAQPYLVAETRRNTSVTIQWTASSFENVSYLVQLRYEIPHQSAVWEYYKPSNILKANYLNVEDLHPYTKYRFRVAWIFLKNYTPLFSEESIVISTLPYGIPSTSPTITCLTTVGCTRLSVCWDPPFFPNGPILSYVLYIREYPTGIITIKDVSDTSGGLYYMFNNLKPETTYIISVSTRNTVGEGPADTRNITTPSKDETLKKPNAPPYLVFGSNQNVLKQGLHILDMPSSLYKTANDSIIITGVALYVEKNLFFVSDSLGNVHRVSLSGQQVIDTIISASANYPASLSIDWLNEKLYMAEENQISRCNFKGNYYEVVICDLDHKPEDMHVDPSNGYLYWALSDAPYEGGLYRVDLIEIENECVSAERTQNIVKDNDLLAFAVDYKNFRLLLPSAEENTIISVALDGSDVTDIRKNSQTPQYTNVRSLAVHHDLLYWTSGTQLFCEEYHAIEDTFYHNIYLVADEPFSAINIHHSDYQPHPVPLNPVESVQAIFGDNRMVIRWSSPRLLGGRGKGSWQKWMYEVKLDQKTKNNQLLDPNVSSSKPEKFRNYTSDNFYNFENLSLNTTYDIRIRAFSPSGNGPWSSEYTGKTLKHKVDKKKSYILWGAQEGLLKSNFIGDYVEHLMSQMYLNNAHVTDISWYEGTLFLNTNTSMVYSFNGALRHSLTKLQNITKAASIAVDWLAPKLYWSSPAHKMISRSNLDSSYSEPLPIITMAKEIAIDAINGYLYWATSHSVECSRLNGMNSFVYMKNELFSGKHVMGLTLDLDHLKVYWMIRSFEGSLMYRAPLADSFDLQKVELVGPLNEDNICGPMWYFSDRLFWLQENQELAISDVHGKNFAVMKGFGLNGVTSAEIIDPSLHRYPDRFTKETINVTPNSIIGQSINVIGTWDGFNITWDPVETVNYGTVFYEIKVDDGDEIYSLITEDPIFVYPSMKHLAPYSALTVAIKSFTYWVSTRQTVVSIYSPMSSPSKPLHPRIFITYKTSPVYGNQDIQAKFRWSLPENPNGVIEGYIITCWLIVDAKLKSICNDSVKGHSMQFQKHSLLPNTTYYFQVQAFTAVGKGPLSDIVKAETSHEHPVPQLLLARADAVQVADIDSHEEKVLKQAHPAAVAYLAQENRVFWVEDGALMSSSLDGTNLSQVQQLKSEGTSLTVDWVGRQLYWTEVNKAKTYTELWSVDLTFDKTPRFIINSSSIINNVEVEPFSRSLIFTSKENESCNLMICDLNGQGIGSFFRRNNTYLIQKNPVEYQVGSKKTKIKRMSEDVSPCNCIPSPSVGNAITIDNTNNSHPEVLWVDGVNGHIWSSDFDGCICHLLVNATANPDNGLPPTSLTVDATRIYWSNETLGRVFSIAKENLDKTNFYSSNSNGWVLSNEQSSIVAEEVRGIRSIRAIGEYLQPYPDVLCLATETYNETSKLVSTSSNAISLYLPQIERPEFCSKISKPSILYTIFYHPVEDTSKCYPESQGSCKQMDTYNNNVTIPNLRPFTNYSIRVSARSFYSREKSLPGPEVIYRTAEGAPSAAVDVTVAVVTPFRIDVTWRPSLFPNADSIQYAVLWRVTSQLETKFPKASYNSKKANDQFSATIKTNECGKTHYIKVRAESPTARLYSDTKEIAVVTHERPNNLTMVKATSHSLFLTWLPPTDQSVLYYSMEFSKNDSQWEQLASASLSTPHVAQNFTVGSLNPKTKYNFRLLLTYKTGNTVLIWPLNSSFSFVTEGDVPSMPGMPHVLELRRDLHKVDWSRSHNNGYKDVIYELQMRSLDNQNWLTVYNSSEAEWIADGMLKSIIYEFRVRAINEFGGSYYSLSEKPFQMPEPRVHVETADDPIGIVIASVAVVVIVLCLSFVSLYIMYYKKKEKEKMIIPEIPPPNHLVPDFELATLQDLPRHGNFVHQTNALYNMRDSPAEEELITLPQIHRNQIIIDKKLGSGAFGDVYEGIFELNESSPAFKIAIKTLKKGATNNEKEEFLKEAILMSNFKHKHILKLLGVCFDNNMNFMILELMEGGDLLSFLRSNNPTLHHVCNLTMDDLLSICIDVAEGCKYLQDMHFVHRDLAARNCLVSSYDREHRIVKIGDFGLARDIYKSDYYRKDGEGLLPVRWMPPESLELGIFTSQSDVWAFGVLLWEVVTLGQQPYAARKNVEVFHYVKRGGRLDKPENCPEDLHEIMKACWQFKPERRCSFSYCLNELLSLRTKLQLTPVEMPSVFNFNYLDGNNGGYIGTDAIPGIKDEKSEGNSEFQLSYGSPSTSNDARSSFQSATQNSESSNAAAGTSRAKYLELLADNEDPDGYQLPFNARTLRMCDKQHETGQAVASLAAQCVRVCNETALLSHSSEEETDKDLENSPSFEDCCDWDAWSLSAASTATYPYSENHRNSGISNFSSLSGIDLNYECKSTCC